MNIVDIGRGNAGRGLAAPWRTAGHELTVVGRRGGDACDADVAGDGARDITEELITDAGYDPVPPDGLDKARAVEDLAWLLAAAVNDGAPVFYRFANPGEL
jgi:predicted dinucleotide-binding enzyme